MTSLNEWIDLKVKEGDINFFEYDEFCNVEKVGEGAFGIVNRADWKSCGIKIALKIPNKDQSGQNHPIIDKPVPNPPAWSAGKQWFDPDGPASYPPRPNS